MRRRALAFASALSMGGVVASMAGACSSFADGIEPTSAADAGALDGGDAVWCANVVDGVRADFTGGRAVMGFGDVSSDGGTLSWSSSEGARMNGALEATTTGGMTQAQIRRDFALGTAKRARLAFSAKLKSVADGGRTTIGCTMQLSTVPLDGDVGSIEIYFMNEDGMLLFDQNSHGGGSSINAMTVANTPSGWTSFELEMNDITTTTAGYRARAGTADIPLTVANLPAPPDHFSIKCGIDSTQVAANILTDDLVFEMCAD